MEFARPVRVGQSNASMFPEIDARRERRWPRRCCVTDRGLTAAYAQGAEPAQAIAPPPAPGPAPVWPIRRRCAPRCSARRRRIWRRCRTACRSPKSTSPALGAAGARRVLVRPQTARVVFGAGQAGAAGHRHFRHRQRRQHREALDAARRALWRRLSRADHAVTDLSRLHRLGVEHRRGRRFDAGRSRPVRGHAADRRASAAQGADHRHRRAWLQFGRRQRRHRQIDRCRRAASSRFIAPS